MRMQKHSQNLPAVAALAAAELLNKDSAIAAGRRPLRLLEEGEQIVSVANRLLARCSERHCVAWCGQGQEKGQGHGQVYSVGLFAF